MCGWASIPCGSESEGGVLRVDVSGWYVLEFGVHVTLLVLEGAECRHRRALSVSAIQWIAHQYTQIDRLLHDIRSTQYGKVENWICATRTERLQPDGPIRSSSTFGEQILL